MLFLMVGVAIAPVYIIPIFNKITHLDDPSVTRPILSMARANGIPATDVYEIDASRQDHPHERQRERASAVPTRITLNDNHLRRGSLEEIVDHNGPREMGHYVLHHIAKDMLFFFILTVAIFAFLRWSLTWSSARWGQQWGIRDIGDPAVLPLVFLLTSIIFFVLTPVLNTHTRTSEQEADMSGSPPADNQTARHRLRFISANIAR